MGSIGSVGSNLISYLPDLNSIETFAQSPDAERSQELLQQVISSFSADQKEVLFNEIKNGNIPDPIQRLRDRVKDLASGRLSPKEFKKEMERVVTTQRSVDGKDVCLPKANDRICRGTDRLSQKLGKLSDVELDLYTKLKSSAVAGDASMPELGDTAASRFLEAALADKGENTDLEKAKRMASAAVDAELIEDTHDVALISAAAGADATSALEFSKGGELAFADPSLSPDDRALYNELVKRDPQAAKNFLQEKKYGLGTNGNATTGSPGSANGNTSFSSRSGAATGSYSSGATGSGDISSRSGAAVDANGNYIPSGISAPGVGVPANAGIDVGNVTSVDLSPTEQQLYDKLKAEDPQAAERFFLQQKLAKISEMAAMLSNIAKMRHDAAMAIIGNMR